jgi:glucosylceramidase
MRKVILNVAASTVVALMSVPCLAQKMMVYTSVDNNCMQRSSVSLSGKAADTPLLSIDAATDPIVTYRAWGTTFNEQHWRALNILSEADREEVMRRFWSPTGDLHLTRGRVAMNGNDLDMGWYSCDSVDGDFQLKYFNIEHDKQTKLPFIHLAQKYYPQLTLWVSPWCPPTWMKINHHYAVQSNRTNDLDPRKDYLLFGDGDRSDNEQMKPDKTKFPRRLTCQDFFIQDPRYLQTYADMFARFIDLYKAEGAPVDMVMFQNESYSYTPYPGCPWTPQGTIRFNMEYLAPTLQKTHPEVALYMGTFNTNRYDNADEILSDPRMKTQVKGVGLQWEGREILARLRKKFPEWSYICSECECGGGTFDWKAGEHVFELINHYLGNGCNEFFNWNGVLADDGKTLWGWPQNALVHVDSKTRTYTLTPEYYAFMHYSHFIEPGADIVGYVAQDKGQTPMLVARHKNGKYVVVAANFANESRTVSVKLGKKYLNMTLKAHSMNTYDMK